LKSASGGTRAQVVAPELLGQFDAIMGDAIRA
jgi:hypothetical protein